MVSLFVERRCSLAVTILVAGLPALTWSAEHSAADAGEQLQEVIVTAEFKSENLQKTPLSMTVVRTEEISQNDLTTLSDIESVVPNVTLQPGGATAGKSVLAFIRGVGSADYSYTVEPGVAVYLDDIYLSGQFGDAFDLLDLDRVEVLRGPQGTLFGKNAIGGAIRLISKKPRGDDTGSVELTLGNFSRRDVRGVVDLPLVRDALSFRLAVASKQRDGYVRRLDFACTHPDLLGIANPGAPYLLSSARPAGNCGIGTGGGENVQAARATVRWLQSERFEVNFAADWMNDHSGPGAQALLAVDDSPGSALNNPFGGFNAQVAIPFYGVPYDNRFVTGNIYKAYDNFQNLLHIGPSATFLPATVAGITSTPARNAVETYGVSATIEWLPAAATHVKSITAYRGYSGEFSQDVGGAPISVAAQTNLLDHHQFSQELQILGKLFDAKLDWAAGVFYFDSYSLNRGPVTLSAYSWLQPDLDFTQNDPSNIRDRAVFAQATWQATQRLTLILGVRHTHEYKDYLFRHTSFDPGVPSLVPDTATEVHYGKTNGRASINYQWTPRVMSYLSASNAFRAGGFNGRPFNASQVVSFGPEALIAYEAGVKIELFDRRLRLNADTFLSRYENLQLGVFELDATGTPFSATVNQGRAQITGAEAELEWLPVPAVMISGNFGLNKYRNKDLGVAINCNAVTNPISTPAPGADCTFNGPLPGAPLPALPERTASLAIQYTVRFAEGSSLTPHLAASFQSRTYFDAIGSSDAAVASRVLLEGRLTWSSRNSAWQIALSGTNLTNRQYFVFKQDLRGIYGMLIGQPGPPRQWAASIKRNFL